jgi:mono/diheme cytochrome c family protein
VFASSVLYAANSARPPKPASKVPSSQVAKASSFERDIQPLLANNCTTCHNDQLASGGLDLAKFSTASSILQHRDGWERIVQKVRTGEMPPEGLPRLPVAQIEALVKFVQSEFEKADRNVKPDPGRVTARRLNRNEYSNTIRDLLAVDFRAERDFPTDDSGHGFDNMSDVLTISPVLMEKYIAAAERIASRAIGGDPLPKKPVEAEYHIKHKTIRRLDASTIEATHRLDWDGEYIVRIGLPGERGQDAKPVTLGFWMNGKLLQTSLVETKPS